VDAVKAGRVIRFDESKGYGFIAPDDGGEDVFVHANELSERGIRVATGTRVQFKVLDGGRGLKAYDVVVLDDQPASAVGAGPERTVDPAPADVERPEGWTGQDEDTCEVFSSDEFLHRITDLLLEAAPQMTGGQVVELRQHLLTFAKHNGWVE
jgi:CspA family cold shock protein